MSLNESDISGILNTTSGAKFQPEISNIYLIRITDSSNKNFERVVKLYVDSIGQDHIVIRWDVLKDYQSLRLCGVLDRSKPIDPRVYENSSFFGSTPGWVIAIAVGLFVIAFLLIIFVVSLFIIIRRSEN